MKTLRFFMAAGCVVLVLASCSAFKPKSGCPSNGKNVGAEKLLSDPDAAKKAKKFRS